MLKKTLTLFIITSFFLFSSYYQLKAQGETKGNLRDKLIFGGNVGLQFGSETRIDVSPEVGYKITDRFVSGVGLTYEYYSSRYFDFNTVLYGGKVFSRYLFFENIFGQIEYEALSLESKYFDVQNLHADSERFIINSVFVGGGFRQPIGKNSAFLTTVLWNLNDTPDSPYSNPIIRIGFTF